MDDVIQREEFVSVFKLMFAAWRATQQNLSGYGAISAALSMVASLLFWCVAVLVVLAIFGVNFLSIYIPLSTIVIGLGFALGERARVIIIIIRASVGCMQRTYSCTCMRMPVYTDFAIVHIRIPCVHMHAHAYARTIHFSPSLLRPRLSIIDRSIRVCASYCTVRR